MEIHANSIKFRIFNLTVNFKCQPIYLFIRCLHRQRHNAISVFDQVNFLIECVHLVLVSLALRVS